MIDEGRMPKVLKTCFSRPPVLTRKMLPPPSQSVEERIQITLGIHSLVWSAEYGAGKFAPRIETSFLKKFQQREF